jgi:hypothetical protein
VQLDYLAGYAQHSLLRWRLCIYAGVAHLVERHLAKVEVAGSSPVARSTEDNRSKFHAAPVIIYGDIAKW